ncbi:MAG: SCP2 sterol-binding domain-containing protein [Butyrivibrio sp.]|nr:SCP2 sterol-binding domain-containing protein [Butyrivibrio sp.]
MKINIYYGGRGIIDDPTLYVLSKITNVFNELNVKVERFNLYEQKSNITSLANTLKDADGIILASTVEWFGIGGYMMQFLDACWLYGDKEKIKKIYMSPVVMSTTYGEREGMMHLASAWEMLGGQPCDGMCGYIADTTVFENNTEYAKLIEKKAENIYRTINQKMPSLPCSNQAVSNMVSITQGMDLTPQESEQLSEYVSDAKYVQKQKEDLKELTDLFKNKMGHEQKTADVDQYKDKFEKRFRSGSGVIAKYKLNFTDVEQHKELVIDVNNRECKCIFDSNLEADVTISITTDTLNDILAGRMTFQRAFMAGNMKMKGDFKLLRNMDQIFGIMEQ